MINIQLPHRQTMKIIPTSFIIIYCMVTVSLCDYSSFYTLTDIVSNKAISISLPGQLDEQKVAYYDILKGTIQFFNLATEQQTHNFIYLNKKTVKFMQWTPQGLIIVFQQYTKVLNETTLQERYQILMQPNITEIIDFSIARSGKPVSAYILLSGQIHIYDGKNLITQLQIDEELEVASLDRQGDNLYYFEKGNITHNESVILNVYNIQSKQIVKQIQLKEDYHALISSPKKDTDVMVALNENGYIIIQKKSNIYQIYWIESETRYDIVTFAGEDLLICATYYGDIDLWRINYENFDENEIIEQLKVKGKYQERIIYIVGNNDQFAVYTEEFNIYLFKEIFTSYVLMIVIGVIVIVLLIVVIVLLVVMRKRKNQKKRLSLDYEQDSPKKQYKSLHSAEI